MSYSVQYPNRVGAAVDLLFVAHDPVAYLVDCLLLYNEVVIRADVQTFSAVGFGGGLADLARLTRARRLKFCPPMSKYSGASPWFSTKFSLGTYVDAISKSILPEYDDFNTFRDDFVANLVLPREVDLAQWYAVQDRLNDAFTAAAARPEYAFLVPPRTTLSEPTYYRVGLRQGVARICDLVASGVVDLDLDAELTGLLEICTPVVPLSVQIHEPTVKHVTQAAIHKLHRIENLPTLGDMVRTHALSHAEAIDLILSDDATRLREWLRQNVRPGLDVRDAYAEALEALPSKKTWTGWVRFGAVTGVSTLLGALIGDPFAGAATGAAIGAADRAYGSKATEMLDTYHPQRWLSIIRKVHHRRGGES